MIDSASIPVTLTHWTPSYRLIPSRYPTVGLYDAIADPAVITLCDLMCRQAANLPVGRPRPPARATRAPGSRPAAPARPHRTVR